MNLGRLREARDRIERSIAMTKNMRQQQLPANGLNQWEKAAAPG